MDNMRIEKFDKEKHYEDLCKWLEKRKLGVPSKNMLPDNGAIVPDVACGFLYLTDSSLAFIDYYVTNPMIAAKKRKQALEVITTNLIMWAKEIGVNHLMANSSVHSIQKMAEDNGFKSCGFVKFFIKEL